MKKNLRNALCILLVCAVTFSFLPAFSVFAEEPETVDSGFCGAEGDGENLTWSLNSEGTLTISGTGAMADYSTTYVLMSGLKSDAPWFSHRTGIKAVIVEDGVTYVGKYAFGGLRVFSDFGAYAHIGSVTLPGSVTAIGNSAFYGCSRLQNVSLSEGLTSVGDNAFNSCNALESIFIPESVTEIGASAFGYCDHLTAFAVPAAVTSIGASAFYGCDSLTAITVDPLNENYASDAYGCLYNKSMTELIRYPSAGPAAAFAVPDGVETIGKQAFQKCVNLKEVSLPESVTDITLPAFEQCGITAFTVDAENPSFSSGSDGCLYNKNKTVLVRYAAGCPQTAFTIPNGVTEIGYRAFGMAKNLNTLIFPGSFTQIGSNTLYGCSGLRFISLPGSITKIADSAFSSCADPFKILYAGTPAQWEQIEIEVSGSADSLSDAHIYYNVIDFGVFVAPNDGSHYSHQDPFVWLLDADGTLTVSGEGYAHGSNVGPSNTPLWNDHKEEIRSAVIEEGVLSVGTNAFKNCASLTSVSLPGTLTAIGSYAFYNTAITSVSLPASVDYIAEFAFSDCAGLTQITADPENKAFTSDDAGCLFNKNKTELIQYPAGNARASYTVPDSVTKIGIGAFMSCGSLKNVVLPQNLTSIDYMAFTGSMLENITIPNSVTSLGPCAFESCAALKSVVLPEGVGWIDRQTFLSCESLESVTIPDNTAGIGPEAFKYCSGLKSVTIPESLTVVDRSAFLFCASLQDVFYAGSEAQWNAITFENGNGALTNARIHYNAAWHTPGEPVRENETPATCTACGEYDEVVYCTQCDYEISREHVTAPPTGHLHTEWREGYAATPTAHGHEAGEYCTDCSDYVTGEVIHNKNGKKYRVQDATWLSPEEYAAACAEGDYIIYCSVCGEYGLYKEETVQDPGADDPGSGSPSFKDRFREMMAGWIEVFLRLIRWFQSL